MNSRLFQMRFRQWLVADGPKPEHSYARSWLEDPKLSTALPHVQLFTDATTFDEQLTKIIWPPTIFTQLPDRFRCDEQTIELDRRDEQIFIKSFRQILDQVHLAVLTCDAVRRDETRRDEEIDFAPLSERIGRRLLALGRSSRVDETRFVV